MSRNMKQWVAEVITSPIKKSLPLLSFPCIQLLNVSVKDLVSSSELQAKGMQLIANRTPSSASVSLMDLSVEAEAFGSSIHVSENEVPTVTGILVEDKKSANALNVPPVGAGRTEIYINAVAKAVSLITDRPIFSGVIGPYSLAGRLLGVSEAMIYCYEEPEMVYAVLHKVTDFIISYVRAYKEVGASGVIVAEPLAGLISPGQAREFSHPYVKQIIDSVQTDDFAVIYHNCGDNVLLMANDIYQLGAIGYHFGDAIRLVDMFNDAPSNVLVMGNVSPSAQLLGGTVSSIRETTTQIMQECCRYDNYVISSGCDIPPLSPWLNLDTFFEAVADFYANQN